MKKILPDTDLLLAKQLVYDKCLFNCTPPKPEEESTAYSACTFTINGLSIIYRAAKITPTKTGQFVTLWKRNKNGITEPFTISDAFDFIIISTRESNKLGQFIFPKPVLVAQGIVSADTKEGKRGIRVYPAWCKVTNKQAEKTQKWQTEYFLQVPADNPADLIRIQKIFAKNVASQ